MNETEALLERYRARFRLLSFVAQSINGDAPFSERAAALVAGIAEAFELEACVLRLVEGDFLVHAASVGLGESGFGPIPVKEGIAHEIISKQRPVAIRDVQSHPITSDLAMQQEEHKFRFRGYAGSPMIYEGRVIGILGVYSVAVARSFTQIDLRHLQIIANSVASIVVNNNLLERLHERTAELEEEIHFRQEYERKFVQAQKFELLGLLSSTFVHDFNNLLSGLLGSLDLAKDEIPPNSSALEYLRMGIESGEAARGLCRQLLVFSGRSAEGREPIDLNRSIQEFMGVLRASIPKSTHLHYEMSRAAQCVRADPTELRQILLNLVINGSDALDGKSGSIKIATAARDCDERDFDGMDFCEAISPGQFALLEVSDTGRGMDAETLKKILDPFYTTKRDGRGLGLASVIGILRRYGGGLKIESVPSEGSTFQIFLPLSG